MNLNKRYFVLVLFLLIMKSELNKIFHKSEKYVDKEEFSFIQMQLKQLERFLLM